MKEMHRKVNYNKFSFKMRQTKLFKRKKCSKFRKRPSVRDSDSMFKLRLCSHLMPEHGARERFLTGTNVNTPLFQVPTPEFGHGARARV